MAIQEKLIKIIADLTLVSYNSTPIFRVYRKLSQIIK